MNYEKVADISIIISTKNNCSTIYFVLNSTLQLTYKYNVELIVVNGNSTDCTENQIKNFFKAYGSKYYRTVLLQDPGKSLSLSRYLGYIHSTGNIIIFLDGDVLLGYNFVHYFEEEISNADLVSTNLQILCIDDATCIFNDFTKILHKELKEYGKDATILPEARIFRRKVIDDITRIYVASSCYFGEDKILTTLAILKGFRYKYSHRLILIKIDEPTYLSYIRKHIRYGKGIHQDLTQYGKQVMRNYVFLRRLTYINIILPILSMKYFLDIFLKEQNFKKAFKLYMFKELIDLAMLTGEIISLYRKLRQFL